MIATPPRRLQRTRRSGVPGFPRIRVGVDACECGLLEDAPVKVDSADCLNGIDGDGYLLEICSLDSFNAGGWRCMTDPDLRNTAGESVLGLLLSLV